jgi:hypothetical protein
MAKARTVVMVGGGRDAKSTKRMAQLAFRVTSLLSHGCFVCSSLSPCENDVKPGCGRSDCRDAMDGVQREVVHCIGAGIVHSTSFGFGPSRSFFSSVPWPSYHFWLGLIDHFLVLDCHSQN